MDTYLNNSLTNPTYLFHGSPKLLDIVEQRQAHDSNGNSENEDFAVFLTSSFIIASAYAFKDKIKELSKGLDWNFEIRYDVDSNKVNIKFENVYIDDDIEGYIYVFPYNNNYEHNKNSIQYKCHDNIKPLNVVKVSFKDFKKYYLINKELNKDKYLEITYEINSGIPFKWEYEIKDEEIIEFVKSYEKNDNSDEIIDGADIETTYVFKGLKKGKTTIIFKCINFADNYLSQEEEYNVIVDKDLNISLINKKIINMED